MCAAQWTYGRIAEDDCSGGVCDLNVLGIVDYSTVPVGMGEGESVRSLNDEGCDVQRERHVDLSILPTIYCG